MTAGRALFSSVHERIRLYRLHAFLLAYTPALLYADARLRTLEWQLGLGVLTFGLLWVLARGVEGSIRRQLWICVPVATCFEVLGSLIWGGYHYRLGNIPLYVPPGHALVYLFGVTAATVPLVQRHGRRVRHLILALCSAWTLAGVTVLPFVTQRIDVQSLACLPLFAWCVLRSRKADLFAAIWVATTTLELAGTWAGDWTWAATAPWTHLPSANPPAAIAAGYAIIDGSVALVSPLLVGAAQRLRAVARRRLAPAPA